MTRTGGCLCGAVRLFRAAAVSFVMCLPTGVAAGDYPTAAEFETGAKVGNVYSCLNPNGTALFFQIGKITRSSSGTQIFHVQITPVQPIFPPIMHAPFSSQSFAYCLPDPDAKRLGYVRFNRRAFAEGYAEWKKAKGGVFTIEITEISSLLDAAPGTATQ